MKNRLAPTKELSVNPNIYHQPNNPNQSNYLNLT